MKTPERDNVIEVAERLYKEINPNTRMDTPSWVYEKVERLKKLKALEGSDLDLYTYCKQLSKNG